MNSLFENIYNYLSKRKVALAIIFVLLISGMAYLSSKLKLEEDITKMLPDSPSIKLFNNIYNNSSFADKTIFNLYFENSKSETYQDDLIEVSDSLVNRFQTQLSPEYIKEIAYSLPEDKMQEVYNYFYENLPLFLDSADYLKIDTLIASENITKTIERNYKTLITPAGFAFKKFIKLDPLSFTPIVLNKLKQLQVDEDFELYQNRIFSKDKKHLIFYITPKNPPGKTAENKHLFAEIDKIIESIQQASNNKLHVEYFGSTVVANGNAQQIIKDIIITLLIASVFLFVLISLYYKNFTTFFLIFLPVVFGSAVAITFFSVFYGSISAITLGIGSVLLGISVDYGLHIFTHYKHTGSVKTVLKEVSLPMLIGCVTTALAFLGLTLVESALLHELGIFAAISVVSAALFSLIIFPLFLRPINTQSKKEGLKFIDKIANYNYHKNPYLLLVIGLLTIVFVFFVNKVGFEDDMNKMSYVSEKLQKAEQNLDDLNNYTLRSVYVLSTGKNLDEALKTNNKTQILIDSLKSAGIVKKYHSVHQFLLSDNQLNSRIENWNQYWSDEKKHSTISNIKEASIKTGFKEDAFDSFFKVLNKQYETNDYKNNTELSNLLKDYVIDTEQFKAVLTILKIPQSDRKKVNEIFSNIENVVVLDKQFITSSLIEVVKKDFNFLVVISMLIVFLLLVFSFGRIELGIISFTPILLSWLWIMGIMGLFGIKFNIVNIIITTFIFGCGIDYSIFITKGLMTEYKTGRSDLKSFKTSILIALLTTLIGIGVLIFAGHPALKSIAVISIIGLLTTILISYTITPRLFYWITKIRGQKRVTPMTLSNLIYSLVALTIFSIGSGILTVFIVLPILGKKPREVYHGVLRLFSKFVIYIMFNVKKKIFNKELADFKTPKIIIVNHQSHIDILLILMLAPKLIILTNDWVQKNFFYGLIVRFAEFYPVSNGYENSIDVLSKKVKDGYSIVIFPEGSRSQDSKIKRFHKGAFYIAEKLNLDILPIVIHGTGDCMTKGEPFLKSGKIFLKYLPVISKNDKSFGDTYKERTKQICKYFRQEFAILKSDYESNEYFRMKLINNFIYKGPVLEWYLRIKIRIEKDYNNFLLHIPLKARITDLGCGYGFLSYILYMRSEDRIINGYDYDLEKIQTANNCSLKNPNVNFHCADISAIDYPESDVFIISDVLHYLPENKQKIIIEGCINKLLPNGKLLIKEADSNMEKRHSRTKLTEFMSTKVVGFNQTYNDEKQLFFISKDNLINFVSKHNCKVEIIDNTTFTSNIIYVISKN